ncbi:MMPL family transporter [Nocardia puris]|uniref:MMPL family transporter n=1 Tax=Nocardia puris TaxID=208602 RepID=UPI0018946B37|nr:MMPL family transporter [Nocardia puris]MBF6211636.1 MMPL family transporter [Nocardia puris]MBF6365639.1 MMPL family transporter [Nocardia puris]MBF6460718.1 MMPL family transporter [Nocardia puris]
MLGRFVTHRPRSLLAAALAAFLLLVVLASGAMNALSLNRFENPNAESAAAAAELADRFDTGAPNVAVLVTAADGDVRAADVEAVGTRLTDALAEYPGVGDAWSFWSEGAPDTLATKDFSSALVLAWVPGDADRVRGEILPGIEADVVDALADPAVTLSLGGADEVFRDVAAQASADFIRAELIVLPLVFGLLALVLRRAALAAVTVGIGLFCVIGTLAALRVVSTFTDVSTFAANIALVMGIGLGVDYGLFMIYRFREELTAGHDVPTAVRRAVAGAGRTIAFSASTVAISLAVLFAFPFPFLQSFAYAGIAVAVTAVVGSVVILPAALMLLGRRALPKKAIPAPEQGFWYRTAEWVMRKPVLAGGSALLVLLLLGAPALGVNFGPPDDRVVGTEQPVRALYDTIRADFETEEADVVHVVSPYAERAAIAPYAERLAAIPGVLRVDSAAGTFGEGASAVSADPGRFADGEATWLRVLPTGERLASDPDGLVREIRSVEAPFEVLVGGYPAELADYSDGVIDRLPLVAALIMLVTFAVLFLMTGSVLAPLKASVLNLLSMSIMFGVLVWGFQNGALAGILGFTPTGVIEPSIPILMFCIAYGLSMDYEVFLLARIKEDYDRTGDPIGSVPRGIARSAPLITAAALILAASFAVYATGGVAFLQQLGIGMALTVAIDATLVRGILVPALMRLAGSANWWAPAPLRRFHNRFGLKESVEDVVPEAVPSRV